MKVLLLAAAMLGLAANHVGATASEAEQRQRALEAVGLLVGSAEPCDYEIDQDRYDALLQRRPLTEQDMRYLEDAIRRASAAMSQFKGETLAKRCADAEKATRQLGIVADG